jgi:hypothetical protein
MGTAFMLTQESPIKQSLKDEILKTGPEDPRLLRRVLASADPKAYAEVQAMRGKVPLEEWLGMLERVNIKDDDWQKKSGPGTTETVSASDPTRMV